MKEKFTTITFMDYEIIDFQYEIVSKIYNYMKSKNYEVDFIYKLSVGFQMPPFWLVLKVNEDAVVTYYFHCRYEELLQWRQFH